MYIQVLTALISPTPAIWAQDYVRSQLEYSILICVYVCIYVCRYVCVYVYMYVCMCVYMYVCTVDGLGYMVYG